MEDLHRYPLGASVRAVSNKHLDEDFELSQVKPWSVWLGTTVSQVNCPHGKWMATSASDCSFRDCRWFNKASPSVQHLIWQPEGQQMLSASPHIDRHMAVPRDVLWYEYLYHFQFFRGVFFYTLLETRTHNAWRRFTTFSGGICHFRHDDCIVLSAWHDESLRSLLLSAWSRMCLFSIPAPGDPSGNTYVGLEDCLNWPTMLEHTDKTAVLAGANTSACPQTVWGHMFCPHEGNILEMILVESHCCQSQQAPLSWYTPFTLGTFLPSTWKFSLCL